jgi:hypothetical protein
MTRTGYMETSHCPPKVHRGCKAGTPDSAPLVVSKVGYCACRNIPRCASEPQASPHDHKKSQEDILQLLSVRNVFWQHDIARDLSPGKMTRRFRALYSGGPELLNQIFDSTRVTALEKVFLQWLATEDSLLSARATESSLLQLPRDLDNGPKHLNTHEESCTFSCLGTPNFDDPLFLNQVFDAQYIQLLTGEHTLSSAWTTESSPPKLSQDLDNGPDLSTAHHESHTFSCPGTPHFEDALILPVTIDSEDDKET